MDIGLCMTVKNEANRIEACLDDIADLFTEIVVIDTGSTDDTIAIVRDKYGIEPLTGALEEARCFTLADLRNQGYARLKTPWVMCLDADEKIPRGDLKRVTKWGNDHEASGFFTAWLTTLPDGRIVEDYKLSLFRQGFGKRGLVHDNVQPSLREKDARAEWTDAFEILHYPEPAKLPDKDLYYATRLARAISLQPDWMRYYWFRALLLQRLGREGEAQSDFEQCFASRSRQFPVECLNSGMSLVGLTVQAGDADHAARIAEESLAFYAAVESDFEVEVNFRIKSWFERALDAIQSKDMDRIVPYDFAHGGQLRGK